MPKRSAAYHAPVRGHRLKFASPRSSQRPSGSSGTALRIACERARCALEDGESRTQLSVGSISAAGPHYVAPLL